MPKHVCVYSGEALASYHFGASHPFGPQRHAAFVEEFTHRGLQHQVDVLAPVLGNDSQLLRFHTPAYVAKVKTLSQLGQGYLDSGDTPVMPGIYQSALYVVGTTLDALDRVMRGEYRHAFIPIAGLHHARRDSAAGFCVFNDCGVAIETLRSEYGFKKIAYVDIDAHHGDGVFYSFEDDPDLCFVDMHEDGAFLYPGTGAISETGQGQAQGTKLNLPMPPYADDEKFLRAWERAESFVWQARPEFILLQCGADSLRGDPITQLNYSSQAHAHAAARLSRLANDCCQGRLVAMGGGGYNLRNIAEAWCAVIESLIRTDTAKL